MLIGPKQISVPVASATDNWSLRQWQDAAYQNSEAHGFHDGFRPEDIPMKLALLHSEVSEALECYREGAMKTNPSPTGKPEGFPSELADIVIRAMDLAGLTGVDLQAEIALKHNHNLMRPPMHGKKC